MSVGLLVIDEVGFEPMPRQEVGLFFRLVSYHQMAAARSSITTNKGVAKWPGGCWPPTRYWSRPFSFACSTRATCSTSAAEATDCANSSGAAR